MEKIEFAGGNAASFEQASQFLSKVGDISISAKHVQRLTERVGEERRRERDADVEKFRAGTLAPARAEPARVVAIHIDGGKLQLRDDDGAPGVRTPRWGDTKVASLVSYTSPLITNDPQEAPPAAFLNRKHVARLCAEMERVSNAPGPMPPSAPAPENAANVTRPRTLVKTAVATRKDTKAFGWMVAAEAQRRGFYAAERRAIVGDGGNWIEPLGALHFPGFTQVLDFLHLLVHLYEAAATAFKNDANQMWSLYETLLRAAWAGRVGDVIAGLEGARARLGRARSDDPKNHPRQVLDRAVEYVRTNKARMDYPRYRREGLPSSSALIESLIKQFNRRVKGSEKFWTDDRAEAVLQVRAAYLCDDDRGPSIYGRRARWARAVGSGRLKAVA